MPTIHPVKCDSCQEQMMFQEQVKDAAQSYRCFNCADRWAIAHLNRHGGVWNIDYMNRSSMNNRMLFLRLAGAVGDAVRERRK
jgi:hypothetical protein